MQLVKNIKSGASKIASAPLKLIKRSGKTLSKTTSKIPGTTSLRESLRSKDIRRRLLITAVLLLLYRLLAAVPLPGIDVKVFDQVFANSPLNNLFTVVTGGRLDHPSVMSIGLGAYINASIIIQLLQTVIPKFEELSKEGERGKQILNQYTRILTIPLTIIQAIVIYTILKNTVNSTASLSGLLANVTTFDIVTMIAALTAGSMILMWIGELITEYGIGNGISMIIMVSILTTLPSLIVHDFSFLANDFTLLFQNGNLNVLLNENFRLIYAVLIGTFFIVLGVVYITEAVRKIVIQYARRIRAGEGMQSSYLPLKINQAGVIPVIFASSLLAFPQIISQLFLTSADHASVFYKVGDFINNSFLGRQFHALTPEENLYYYATFFVLIIVFTFFYTFVTYKPSETAENLQKSGGFIPGLRPGKATEKFITYILIRLTFVGALFLGVIALIPNLVRLTPQGSQLTILSGIGGTSILIIIGVIIDTMRQMKSLTVTKSYDQYK